MLGEKRTEKRKNLLWTYKNGLWMILGFLFPAIIAFTLNIGLIWKLRNVCNNALIKDIVEYLSRENKAFQVPAEYFVGTISLFILFFSFAQFSYSRQVLPTNLIRKYVLADKHTNIFIGSQLSFAAIIGCITFFNIYSIHNLNYILIFVVLFASAVESCIYFYWVLRNVSAAGMFKLIEKKFDFKKIKIIEEESLDANKNFMSAFNEEKYNIKFNLNDYLGLFLAEQILIPTTKRGVVKNIDIRGIDNILLPYKDIIRQVIIDVKIGQYVPIFEPYPHLTPRTILMRINTKLATDGETRTGITVFKNRINNDERFQKSIENCVKIDSMNNIYEENRDRLKDLLLFHLHALETEPAEGKGLIGEFSSFISRKLATSSPNVNFPLATNLLLELINIYEEELRQDDKSAPNSSPILRFIYSMGRVAAEGKSHLLLSKLLGLSVSLFRKLLSSETSQFGITQSAVLHIQEIGFNSIVYNENTTVEQVQEYFNTFYVPIIRDTILQSSVVYYLIIKYSFYNDLGYELLLNNSQHLISLLSPIDRWEPVDELRFSNSKCFNQVKSEIINTLALNILYLAIFIYKSVSDEKLPKKYLANISFPLADNCNSVEKFSTPVESLLDSFFYSYDFKEGNLSFLNEEFELNRIHESGAYSPLYYDFNAFWITYSLYRIYRNLIPIPSAVIGNSSFEKTSLINLLEKIRSISINKEADFLNLTTIEIRRLKVTYENHITNLINLI